MLDWVSHMAYDSPMANLTCCDGTGFVGDGCAPCWEHFEPSGDLFSMSHAADIDEPTDWDWE